MIDETEVELPPDVVDALVERGSELGGHDVVLLPSQVRGGKSFYMPDDMDSLRQARSVGLDLVYLQDGEQRRYLHENAAGWEIAFAIGVASGLTATSLSALIKYAWERLRAAKQQGLFEGDEKEVPMKATVARVTRKTENEEVTATALKLEGPSAEVLTALEKMLGEVKE
jgi:hypothetical protein